jgi:ComF family protein
MPIPRVDRIFNGLNYRILPPLCRLCGEDGQPALDLCTDCQAAFPITPPVLSFDYGSLWAGFSYAEPVAGLIQRFKFQEDLGAGRLLARLALGSFTDSKPKALIPVPLHASRLRSRGYNQALELADFWGKCRGIPVRPCQLIRTRATHTQSSLPATARYANVDGAFKANTQVPEHVALIDDVVTTGATTTEAVKALLNGGAKQVDVWCLARVL